MAKKSSARYIIGEGEWDGKPERYLSRSPADLSYKNPNRLYIIRGVRKEIKDLEDPNFPHKTVFLDGACQGIYQDPTRKIYSMDHHRGCFRNITDATCMQALTFARTGVIKPMGYTIVLEDPDPDAALSSHLLLHSDRVSTGKRFFNRIFPLVALENVIDKDGKGLEEFARLGDSLGEVQGRLDYIFEEYFELRAKGLWEKADLLEYTRRAFEKIDELYLFDEKIEESIKIDALEEVALSDESSFVSVVSSTGNLYAAEQEILKREQKKWRKKGKGRKCSCILFHDGRTKYSLKLTGIVSEYDLIPLFKKLSEAETQAKVSIGVIDQQMLNSGWGGNRAIGGGPLYPNGTGTFMSINRVKGIAIDELKRQAEAIQSIRSHEPNGSNGHGDSDEPMPPPADPKVPQ